MTATPRWEIPVLDTHQRRGLLVVIVDSHGNVVHLPPAFSAWIMPPGSDEKLTIATREAREVAERMRESS